MPIRVWLVLACLCFSGSVSAAMVELVFDVLVNQRNVGQLVDGAAVEIPDASFTPQNFSITTRFDLASPSVMRGENEASGYSVASAMFPYESASTSSTPLTAGLQAMLPAPPPYLSSGVSAGTTVYWGDEGDTSVQSFSVGTSFQHAAGFFSQNGHYYQRYFSIAADGGPASRYDFDPLMGEELLDWFTAGIGHTFSSGYLESAVVWTGEILLDANGGYLGVNRLSFDAVRFRGDVTLRSVTVVPLPAVGLALPLLLGMGLAAKHYRRRNAHQ